jgi:Cu(I)/Ag(I) efflux system membrane fusion protein
MVMTIAVRSGLASLLLFVAVDAADLAAPLVDGYLQAQRALASDTIDGVAAAAAAIGTAAAALGKDGEQVAAAARKLQASKDIASARATFGELSEALVAYADKTKTAFGPRVRVAFCPMVNKPWLQEGKAIKNPYYGASMISCGTFR